MALNPGIHEQDLIADALSQRARSFAASERRAELVVGGLYVAVAAALLALAPPDLHSVSVVAAAACLVALAVAVRVEFDTGAGFTVPSQLAFVPLLFVLPPALVLIAVPCAWTAGRLARVASGTMRPVRLLLGLGNSWFAVGPCVVVVAYGATTAGELPAVWLVAAIAAQFVGDLGASLVREAVGRGATVREQLNEAWVYGVDAALTPAGIMAAEALDTSPLFAFGLLPLLAVLAIFARERRARVESLVELNNAYRGTALVLGDVVEADDAYTGEHCRDVVALAAAVGRRLGLDADRLRNLEFGALLHDIGKVAIPKAIINKPGKLDAAEWETVKTHTIEGQRMLDRVGGFMSEVGRIVRSHHERWDGNGYPDGLAGEAIPIEARIVACCDTWNAMTTTRSYRPAMPLADAARELRACTGSQLDPHAVDALLAELFIEKSWSGDAGPRHLRLVAPQRGSQRGRQGVPPAHAATPTGSPSARAAGRQSVSA